jgi:hypothetical protein
MEIALLVLDSVLLVMIGIDLAISWKNRKKK